MLSRQNIAERNIESLAIDYFHKSQGKWKSQRRYYMLKQEVEPQEVESILTVEYLAQKFTRIN